MSLWLINHHRQNVAWVMHRKGGDKSCQIGLLVVAVTKNFFGGACLAANHIAGRLGKVAGAIGVRDNEPHHRTDIARSLSGEDAGLDWIVPGLPFEQCWRYP